MPEVVVILFTAEAVPVTVKYTVGFATSTVIVPVRSPVSRTTSRSLVTLMPSAATYSKAVEEAAPTLTVRVFVPVTVSPSISPVEVIAAVTAVEPTVNHSR